MMNKHTFPRYQAGSGWNALLPARKAQEVAPKEKHFGAVVIGGGVTGLAAARSIAELEPDTSVLILEASVIGEGSSGRNSGFLINLPHNTGMSGHGSAIDVARKQIELYNVGLEWLKGLVDQHGIDCGWSKVGKYHAAATSDGERRLRDNLAHYQAWGVPYREFDQAALHRQLGTRYYRYGYHSDNNVFVQPAAFVRGLAAALPSNVHVWENQPVLSLERGSPFKIITGSTEISADRVVIANNGFATKLGLARDRVFTIYTYAALTGQLDAEDLEKLGEEPEWGVIPANRLGTTLRRTRDGRFMVRSAYSYESEQSIARVRAMLTDCYRRRYPQMRSFDFEHVWGGVTALTRNGAVYFGQVDKGLYVSIGCNGAGMLKGSVFGKLLGEMACGAESPQLSAALGFERPSWLPPEPIRRMAVVSAINYQKLRAGRER